MASILPILFVTMLVFSYVASIVWVYRDATDRGKPGALVAILAAVLAWPMSLLVWIALRPPIEPRDGGPGYRKPFNLQDYRQQ
jgi:hypothetical protein